MPLRSLGADVIRRRSELGFRLLAGKEPRGLGAGGAGCRGTDASVVDEACESVGRFCICGGRVGGCSTFAFAPAGTNLVCSPILRHAAQHTRPVAPIYSQVRMHASLYVFCDTCGVGTHALAAKTASSLRVKLTTPTGSPTRAASAHSIGMVVPESTVMDENYDMGKLRSSMNVSSAAFEPCIVFTARSHHAAKSACVACH